jgi:polyhydroxyalkanoate synthesis regulator phasin
MSILCLPGNNLMTMNNNNIFQSVRKGFQITVGATASVVETLQDPQKRSAAFTEIQSELDQKSQEWAQKGEKTELEARQILDSLLAKQGWRTSTQETAGSDCNSSDSTNTGSGQNIQSELQDLTEQIVSLRNQLENLRKSE